MRVVREASYIEEIDMVVSATSPENAQRIADQFGMGNIANWPDIARYTISKRHPQEYETLKVTHENSGDTS